MQDVLVLLQHLTENEETTIKLIIECLYDVGAINFINKKVQNDSLNHLTKNLAGMSKPIAKRYGYYWFKKNCPELIVNWLKRKVAFPAPKAEAVQQQEAAPKVEPAPSATETQVQLPQSPQHQTGHAPSSEAKAAMTDTAPADISNVINAEINGEAVDVDQPPAHQPTEQVSSANNVQADSQFLVSEDQPSAPSIERQADDPDPADSISTQPLVAVASAAPSTSDCPIENPSSENLPISNRIPDVPPSMEDTIPQPHRSNTPNKLLMESFKVTALPTPMEQKTTQIRRLKTQNKILMGSLAGAILVSGLAIWQLHATQQSALQLRQSTPSSIVPAGQSLE